MKDFQKIEVVPYDIHWPELFAVEVAKIKAALGDLIVRVNHIGSTSIPQIPAKPVIDISLEFDDIYALDIIKEKLTSIGYLQYTRQIIPHRSFFTKKYYEDIGYHLHLYERGDPQIRRHVNFRDFLRTHHKYAKAYADLKLDLAKQYRDDRISYLLGKSNLVKEIDALAKVWAANKNNYLLPKIGKSIENWSEENLAKTVSANFNVYMTHFVEYFKQIEFVRIPGFTLVNSGLPDNKFNYVLDADFNEADAEKKILEIMGHFKLTNSPFSWWIDPFNKPAQLAKYLEKHSPHAIKNYFAMMVNLDTWSESLKAEQPLKIVHGCDKKILHDFALFSGLKDSDAQQYYAEIAELSTPDDPIEYHVGYVDNTPVVCGATCYYAGIAGLYSISAFPDKRQKSYVSAMQIAQLKRAKELGFHIAILPVSSEDHAHYRDLGYREIIPFKEFNFI